MVRLVVVLLLSYFGLMMQGAQAAQNSDNYSVETQVEDQSEAKRIAAVKSGLGEVIGRVSGDAALQHPSVRQAIGNAADYLLQFSYGTFGSSYGAASSGAKGVKLTLSYSAQAVESLLRQAQLPLGDTAPKDAQTLIINVDKVDDFTAFKQVRAYLETIAMIRRSELLSVNRNLLVFRLTLDGDSAQLKSTLASDSRLQVDESVNDDSHVQSNQLAFHWQH